MPCPRAGNAARAIVSEICGKRREGLSVQRFIVPRCSHGPLLRQPAYVQYSVRRQVWIVKTMSYSASRARYAERLDAVTDDREEVVITRAGHEPVVMVALDDYESLKETAYLLKSPENARRLLASIERLENGEGTRQDLAE